MFENAWSSPACSPTRGTIISGQYAHRTGVTAAGNVLPTSTVTLFDRLAAEIPSYSQAFTNGPPSCANGSICSCESERRSRSIGHAGSEHDVV